MLADPVPRASNSAASGATNAHSYVPGCARARAAFVDLHALAGTTAASDSFALGLILSGKLTVGGSTLAQSAETGRQQDRHDAGRFKTWPVLCT
jgi:hypothetical protein